MLLLSSVTIATYGYDRQGQLTAATVGGTSYTYTYDTAGNIQSKQIGGTTTNYTYGNSAWRDLLTAYDGREISYDGCGNPTRYYDGSAFTWTQGRRLATATVGGTSISYTYDMAGVRSSKTVNGTEYKFTTLSGLVTRQEWNGSSIDFIYDDSNQPLAMKYNGTLYYYILNAQGDVVRIIDGSRSTVASYSYDPWGKIVSSSGTLADVNPLRYRGYYYDSETGFYYLQSRYYDPELGRFINADSYASTDATGLLSANMFAYCENDPVNRSDADGELWVQFAMGLASQYLSDVLGNIADGKTGVDMFTPTSSLGDYIASGVSSMIPGGKLVSSLIRSTISTAITEGEKFVKEGKIDAKSALVNFGNYMISDIVSSNILGIVKNKIDIKRPRNYSSFAHIQYLKNPTLTRQDIYVLMHKADKTADRLTIISEIMINAFFSPRKLDVTTAN